MSQRTAVITTLALVGALIAGCKSPAQRVRVLTKDQEKQIAQFVSTKAPKVQHARKIDFEDRISLLGYSIAGAPKAGGRLELSMYFQVHKPVTGDWKIFVHLEAPGKRRQPFDHHGVGGLYPVAQWKAGEYVTDKVHIEIPKDWPNGKAQLLVGLFDWAAWSKSNQNRRLKLAAASKKLGTADNRALVTTITVSGGATARPRIARPKLPPRTYRAVKITAAAKTDGDLSDWTGASKTTNFRQPDGKRLNPAYATQARFAWDDTHLYVAYETRDDEIATPATADDAELWKGDVVELFIQPKGSRRYYEFQWSPNGKHFDAAFENHRTPAWQQAAKWNSGLTSAVKLDGTVNKPGDVDKGWTVEAAIPWTALGGAPKAGDTWIANLYRIDSKGPGNIAFMGAWAPVGPDFHALKGAGQLTFVAAQ